MIMSPYMELVVMFCLFVDKNMFSFLLFFSFLYLFFSYCFEIVLFLSFFFFFLLSIECNKK